MKRGVDWGYGHVRAKTVKDAGFNFVCRYLSLSPGKNITREELQDLKNNSLDVVLVWETTTNRSLQGYEIGQADAKKAVLEADELGIKDTNCIYFACDNDFTIEQCQTIAEYFKGISSILRLDQIGIYGGFMTVKSMLDRGLVNYAWQTSAWSSGHWDPRANIRQVSYNEHLDNVQCDVNEAMTSDFGQI